MVRVSKTKVSATMDREHIGEIRHAMLTEEQFQTQAGKNWILADGRNVEGSRYHQLTGNINVPDVRGNFLRGKNNGRNDGKENPSGDLPLGTYEQDTFESHDHDAGTYEGLDLHHIDLVNSWIDNNNKDDPDDRLTSTWRDIRGNSGFTGDYETTCRNLTTNIFIKIN